MSTKVVEAETLNTELHDQILSLYEQGLFLKAFETSKQAGPLVKWKGNRSRVLAARISNHVGSTRLGRTLIRLAHRQCPTDPEIIYFHTYSMLGRRGGYKTFQVINELGELDGADDVLKSDWFALRGLLYGALRDFEKSDQWINRAIEMNPERAWLHVQRSSILEMQDRPKEAIAAAEHAMELQPWYRPAVQSLAHRMIQDHRDEEAIKLLSTANEKLESGDLRIQLGGLFLELERFEEAKKYYSNIEKYFPLLKMEHKVVEALSSLNADLQYYCGNYAEAAKLAKQAKNEFFDEMAERLTDPKFEGKRIRLPVHFVRQDHRTCAPATLTAIANYWDKPVEQLEIVEEICYDGTPAHSERKWAEDSGYVTQEFRVTWESATALIDRGIPFTLTTCDPGSAHLQAVIGYDEYRHSLLIRDSGNRHSREFAVEKMLEAYKAYGPRGMAMVPKEKAELLEGIKLPETKLYDLYYKLQLALEKHNREFAAKVVERMVSGAPDHRLTLGAESVLARYDSDLPKSLAVIDKLAVKYPKDINFKVNQLALLGELGKAEDRIATLRKINAEPDCHPIFWTQLAGELRNDNREKDTVDYLLRRSLKYRSEDSAAYAMLGGIHFEEQREAKAVEAYRFAACVDDKSENRAKEYFYAARITNDTDTALRFLQDRVQRFGKQSSLPARTLCWAYDQLEKSPYAIKTLQEAYKVHKADGEFLLYTAEYFGRLGKFEKAEQLLAKAKPIAHPSYWTRVAAVIASYQGKNSISLKHWKSLVAKDPLDSVAHKYVTDLLADEGGSEAAITHLRKYIDLFPNSYSLRSMLINWVKGESKVELEKELNEFLRLHPADAWAQRELANIYLGKRDFERAEKHIALAHEVDPNGPATYVLRAAMHSSRNETAQAIEQYREAIKHSIDSEYAIAGLINCCDSKAKRKTQLQFVLDELNRQVGLGEGLITYHSLAQTCLDPPELLATLRDTLKKGDDRWQAWVVVIRQLSDMQQHDEAIELAKKASKKFPLLPRIWMELATANAASGRIDEEIAALRKAKEINPTWGDIARSLAEALEKQGDLEGARKEIEANIRAEPRDVNNYGHLGGILWQLDKKEEAMHLAAKAVRLQPGYEYGWVALRDWCAALGQPDFDVEVATELTESRPNEVRSWMMLALTLDQPHQVEEAIAALDKGLQINPQSIECYSRKAMLLCQLGMYDEAIAAVNPPALANDMPLELVARAAWIEAERGLFDKAIAGMERVLKVDPDYFWAWQEIAQWYRYQENTQKYTAAAEQMVRIQPQNAISWGYLGDSQIAANELEKAKEHFTQAVHLAPTYEYASGRLLDILVHLKNWDEAKAMLDFVTPHLSPEWVVSEKARIAALSGDREVAFEMLNKLADIPSESHDAIDNAVSSIYTAGWGDETMNFLNKKIDQPDALPGVAFVYVHLTTSLNQWDQCEQKINSLRSRPQLWEAAAQKYMVEVCTCREFNQQHRIDPFIANNEQALRNSTKMWERVGSALCQGEMDAKVCDFMSDWRSRKDVSAWGLYSLAFSLWAQKKEAEADQVSRHAIEQCGLDATTGHHMIFAALYQVIYGSPEVAFQLIRDVDPKNMNDYFRHNYEQIICVLQNLGTDGSYAQLRDQLKTMFNSRDPETKKNPGTLRIYNLVQYAAARLHGKKFRAMGWKLKAK